VVLRIDVAEPCPSRQALPRRESDLPRNRRDA
jgi:hypothetical protein